MASARGDGGSLLSRRACHATHPPLNVWLQRHTQQSCIAKKQRKDPHKSWVPAFQYSSLVLTSIAEGLPVSMLPSAVAGPCSRVGDKGTPRASDAAMPALDVSAALFVHIPAACN